MEETTHAVDILSEHLQLLGGGIFVALITSWIAYRMGFYRFPQPRISEGGSISLWEMLSAFFVFFIVVVLLVPISASLWEWWKIGDAHGAFHLDAVGQGWLNVLAICLTAVSLGVLLWILPKHVRLAVWGPAAFISPARAAYAFLFGAAAWLVSYPLVTVVSQLTATIVMILFHSTHHEQVAVHHLKMVTAYPELLWIISILLIVLVPMVEELLFRGFLQTWLKQWVGRSFAILLTAFIFALFHFSDSQGFDNIELLSSLFLLACFLGYVYERQQSLWASIGLHSTFNAISIAAIIMATESPK